MFIRELINIISLIDNPLKLSPDTTKTHLSLSALQKCYISRSEQSITYRRVLSQEVVHQSWL